MLLHFNPLSVASSALPAGIKESLKDEEVTEGQAATLRCELTKVAQVEWRKENRLLKVSDKYKMRQEGTVMKLLIQDVELKDAGEYTCVCGEQKTTAALIVHGKNHIHISVLLCFSLPAHHYWLCVHLWLNLICELYLNLVASRLFFCFCLSVQCPRIRRKGNSFHHEVFSVCVPSHPSHQLCATRHLSCPLSVL